MCVLWLTHSLHNIVFKALKLHAESELFLTEKPFLLYVNKPSGFVIDNAISLSVSTPQLHQSKWRPTPERN